MQQLIYKVVTFFDVGEWAYSEDEGFKPEDQGHPLAHYWMSS